MARAEIRKLVVVFKTHLDVGFTDYARTVKARYLDVFLPQTIGLSKQLQDCSPDLSFVWTTGSWLIYEALEQYKGRNLKALEASIAAGSISWHGLPFTTHCELMDASLFRFGLSLSERLDKRFGKHTISAKMTDVPGHTRSIVPQLADAGIRFLHLGVNPASTAPTTPKAYVWRHPDTSEVTVVCDGNDYGGITQLPGLSSGLALIHSGDNAGPPSIAQIEESFRKLREAYPQAEVYSGRLDDFAEDLIAIKQDLPVVTDEIGDTWIHGVGTDPAKVSHFLELQRLAASWQKADHHSQDAENTDDFRRQLLLIPEHTWGMDEKSFLGDYTHYGASDFRKMRRTEKCRQFEQSWQEQREYLRQAVGKLKGLRRKEAQGAIESLTPRYPSTKGYAKVDRPGRVFDTPWLTIGFDEKSGLISHMKDTAQNRTWATPSKPLASYVYETFSADDYNRFGSQYVRGWPNAVYWAIRDFTKCGLEKLSLSHQSYSPTLDALWVQVDQAGDTRFIVEMSMPELATKDFGSPAKLTTQVHIHAESPEIDVVFQWFDKKACRIPEASWFSFCPRTGPQPEWSFKKMGSWISPWNVVRNGNRKLHAAEEVSYRDDMSSLMITPLDSPLVAPGERSLLNFNNRQPSKTKGVHFNLHNNIWCTNFPMWYEEDGRFRFSLTLT